jgi:hypothetical protein
MCTSCPAHLILLNLMILRIYIMINELQYLYLNIWSVGFFWWQSNCHEFDSFSRYLSAFLNHYPLFHETHNSCLPSTRKNLDKTPFACNIHCQWIPSKPVKEFVYIYIYFFFFFVNKSLYPCKLKHLSYEEQDEYRNPVLFQLYICTCKHTYIQYTYILFQKFGSF